MRGILVGMVVFSVVGGSHGATAGSVAFQDAEGDEAILYAHAERLVRGIAVVAGQAGASQLQDRQALIAALLEKARQALEADRLTTPAEDNALDYAQQVLAIEPGHPEVPSIIDGLVKRYQELIEGALSNNRIEQARRHLDMIKTLVARFELSEATAASLASQIAAREQALAQERREQQQAARIERMLTQGREALEAGRLDNATQHAQQVLALDPGNGEAQNILDAAAAQRFMQRAEAALARDNPQEARRFHSLARIFAARGGLPETDVAQLAQRIDEHEQALNERRQEQQRLARISELVEKARQALEEDRLDTPAKDNAVYYAEQLLTLDPQHQEATRLLGQVVARYLELGDNALEAGALEQAEVHLNQAQALVRQHGLSEGAVQALAQGIMTGQQALAERRREEERLARLDALIGQGKEALRAGRLNTPAGDNAVEYFEQVLVLEPQHEEAKGLLGQVVVRHAELGKAALERGTLEQAGLHLTEGRRLAKRHALAETSLEKLNEDIAEEQQRREVLAAREREQAVREARIADLVASAEAALEADRLTSPRGESAADYAEKALELDPQHSQAQGILAQIMARITASSEAALKEGRLEEAKGHLQEAKDFGKRHGLSELGLDTLADAIAVEEQRRLAEKQPTERESRIAKLVDNAKAALASDRLTTPAGRNAVEYAGQVLELEPEHPGARQVLFDVIARYGVLGKAALSRNQVDMAEGLQKRAQELVQRYRLPEDQVTALAESITAQKERLAQEQEARERQDQQGLAERQRREEEASRGEKSKELLAQAKTALNANRLGDPADDNAIKYAEELLALAPEHPGAEEVLSGVVGRYVVLGEVALSQQQLKEAQAYRDQALAVAKKHGLPDRELRSLSKRIARTKRNVATQARKDQAAERLIAQARQALAAHRFTSPAGQSAVGFAEQLLALSPDHKGAREILQEVVAGHLALGEGALEQGDLDEARFHYRAAADVTQRFRLPDGGVQRFTERLVGAEERVESELGSGKKKQIFIPPSF